MNIRELRIISGLTQQEFAKKFDIPVGTLRRWEYGESTPAKYIVNLIAAQIPKYEPHLQKFSNNKGDVYYFDESTKIVMDQQGTKIKIEEDLLKVKKENICIYLKDLFESYYEIVKKFNEDCKLDQQEDIIWS